ncbi:unnamed protein product (macronuclear) [Paramecium tetraurelia]|uniref:VWFA domain-containing protein n=1 Tax=Paramecium tetraurelia TaxID=5888 RepID=A0BC70_PARTE|nr:uncharacterized protein GSPATT00004231001 [Paramecium tetraurelia]CAK56137.1 unnamed protein product [Paramecium tetraurelia]|eukprot:XP_001423535.1 hypothetical protein (macronuclear) [Paramecium tetraurelia strain d4-2]
MSSYYLYQAPLPKQLISTLFDGTNSMKREYHSIISTYNEVFNDFSQTERQQYQWTKGLSQINPFIGADFGNLNQSLNQIFLNLLSAQFPQYITIILITDGGEPLDSESLEKLIQEVKSKYFIQFITIVISEQPTPIKVLETLNALFKSEKNNFNSEYIIKRSSRKSIYQIQKDFREAFTNIKQQLVSYQQQDILDQKVSTIINQSELTDKVAPKTLFLAEKGIEISTQNVKINKTTQICHILQILQKSFLATLKKFSELTVSGLKNECSEILRVTNQLLSQTDNDNRSDEFHTISLILKIITSIINNTCNWQSIDCHLFDDLCLAVSNAQVTQLEQLSLINQSECSVQKIHNIDEQMISKLDNLSKNAISKLDYLIKQDNIIIDTLKLYIQLFSTEIKSLQDQKAHLKKLVMILQNQLSVAFQQQEFETIFTSRVFMDNTEKFLEQLQQLFKLNNLLKMLKQISIESYNEQLLQSLSQLIKLEQNSNNQSFKDVFIFYKDLKELPILKELGPNDDQEDNESIFVLLINLTEAMKLVIDNLTQSYQKGFKDISSSKRIELVYVNKNENNQQMNQEFYFLNQRQQQEMRFTSLIELFQKNQEKFQLKQKKINLCILIDDELDYWKLQLQITMLKLSQYYVKLSFIALGLPISQYIQKEIEQIVQQYSNEQISKFFIPKNKYNLKQKKKYDDKHSEKLFEEIANKFKQNKL